MRKVKIKQGDVVFEKALGTGAGTYVVLDITEEAATIKALFKTNYSPRKYQPHRLEKVDADSPL